MKIKGYRIMGYEKAVKNRIDMILHIMIYNFSKCSEEEKISRMDKATDDIYELTHQYDKPNPTKVRG